MKILTLLKAINYIANLPGNASIEVYYNIFNTEIMIVEIDSYGIEIKPEWKIVCAGQPSKFFDALNVAIYNTYIHKKI
jgi:hypothetical protein